MNNTPFLFVDLETSGLDERVNHLLEVGLMVVSADLTEVAARGTWNVPYRSDSLDEIRRSAHPDVRDMHDTNGLWDACRAVPGVEAFTVPHSTGLAGTDLGDYIAHWVTIYAGDPAIPLCGSSVAFDQRWLNLWLPAVVRGRTYRLPDPSGLREMLERWAPHIVASRPPSRHLHRVAADLDDTLAEMRHYQVALGLAPAGFPIFPAVPQATNEAGVWPGEPPVTGPVPEPHRRTAERLLAPRRTQAGNEYPATAPDVAAAHVHALLAIADAVDSLRIAAQDATPHYGPIREAWQGGPVGEL